MGRKKFEEELRDWFNENGLDFDQAKTLTELPPPEEMLEEFKRQLYLQAKSGKLTQTGLVNGLKAVADLAEAEAERRRLAEAAQVDTREIDVILADVGLPRERRVEIAQGEIQRLKAATRRLQMTVARIEGEPE